MEQREMALVPMNGGMIVAAGTTPLYPPFKGGQGAYLSEVPAGACRNTHATGEAEEVQMRLWEEMAKNRVLDMELECAHKRIRAEAKRKEARKQLRKEALKLLGWLGVGLGCGLMAMACWFMAPRWTCIAPVVLMGLAWWKAGVDV